MNSLRWVAWVTIPVLMLLAGCGEKKTGELTDKEKSAFDSASPELKQSWQVALETSKTNDYVGAQTLLYGLLNQNLSPEQRQAVTKESTALNQRLYDGVAKGDPAALKAMEDMRHNPPGRPVR